MTLANPFYRLKPSADGLPRVFFVTDDRRYPDPLPIIARLPVGCGVLLRHYDWPHRRILAQQIALLCQRRRLSLWVAADWRLAADIGADGVHLPQGLGQSGRLAGFRLWQKRGGRVSMACHDRMALADAGRLKLDLAFLSPIFPTASHPSASGLGAVRCAFWSRQSALPVVALGGVNRRTSRQLRQVAAIAMATPDAL